MKEAIHELQVRLRCLHACLLGGRTRSRAVHAATHHNSLGSMQEFYADFCVLDSHHFTIPCTRNDVLLRPKLAASSSSTALE